MILTPDMTMLTRLYWHNAKSAPKVDATHKDINVLKTEVGLVMFIACAEEKVRYDGIHLNGMGNAVFLCSLSSPFNDLQGQGVLKLFYKMQKGGHSISRRIKVILVPFEAVVGMIRSLHMLMLFAFLGSTGE